MGKKGVIVYYSWIGNTKMVAEELQRLTSFDLVSLIERKPRPIGSVFSSVMGAIFGIKSQLEPVDYEMEGYETLILGAQVWAGKTTPAVNRFLKEANFSGKKIHLFITMGDDKVPEKVIDSIKSRIESKGGKVDQILSLTTKWDPKVNKPVALETVKDLIDSWVKEIK